MLEPTPRLLAVLLLGLMAGPIAPGARAQTATVSGFVTDASTGQALELANVALRQDGDLVRGASTNPDGLYILPRVVPGRYVLRVSSIGYETSLDTLQLVGGESLTLNVALEPEEAELDEVVVEEQRGDGAGRATGGQVTIRPSDVEYVPTPDVAGDLAAYLSAQPGVVTTGDRGGQFFIRGGEPSQNLVQVDGILLYQPFHLLGFYSALPSEVLNRVDLYAGGYGSKYGGRVSSVIDISTRNGNMKRYAGSVAASPFISTFSVEGPLVPNRLSLLVSGRRSTVEEGAARYVDHEFPLRVGDLFAKLSGVLSSNSRASATALSTYDRGTLGRGADTAETEEIGWYNDAIGVRLLSLPRIVSIMADLHLSYSRLHTELGPAGAPTRTSTIENTFVALDATYFGDQIDVEAGTSLRASRMNSEIGGLFQGLSLSGARVSNWGSYIEVEYAMDSGLRIRPGLRAQFYAVRFDPYLEPRLRLVFDRGIHQLSGSVGLYHQEIIGLTDRRDAAGVFTVWTHIPRHNPYVTDVRQGRLQRAVHGIAGYSVRPTPWLDVSLEGYYKDLTNLFISEWTSFPRFTTRLQPATGRAMGADARIEFRRPPFYGLVNYGLSSTQYVGEQRALKYWYGDDEVRFRPAHDRRHQLNAIANVQLFGFELGLRWEFGSGLPFSRAVGFDGFALIDDIEKVVSVPRTRRVIYERPFNAVLPTYHRLDVSLERSFSFGPTDVVLQGSVINLYDRRNIFYLDVYTLQRADQMPLVPSLGIKVIFD